MSNGVNMHVKSDVLAGLKRLVSLIEDGSIDIVGSDCTVFLGRDVYHYGHMDDGDGTLCAVWNCTYAIHKLMSATMHLLDCAKALDAATDTTGGQGRWLKNA